jgi:hypothetical protein
VPPAPVSQTCGTPSRRLAALVGMVEVRQTLEEAAEEIVSRLCGVIDLYVAVQRTRLARFPERSAGAVALGAQLDQLEAMAREGARVHR